MCGICRKIHANDVDFGELLPLLKHDMGLQYLSYRGLLSLRVWRSLQAECGYANVVLLK